MRHNNSLRLALISFVAIHLSYGLQAQQNMLRKWVTQKPLVYEGDVISTSRTNSEVLQTTEYFDGLGRTVQRIAKRSSPLQKDVVEMHEYDAFGREVKMYMPFVSQITQAGDITDDGNFKTTATAQQVAFNQGVFPSESFFYSQLNIENSSQNRILNSYPQGSSWGGASRGTIFKNLVNTAIDNVRKWDILDPAGSIPTSPGAYTAGQLYKVVTTDEKGLQVIEFKDRDGHIVLTKSQLTAAADAGTGSDHPGWICTYYVYDDYGNLRFIITPKAVELITGTWAISQLIADELCYRYEYDDFARRIIEKSPGAGEEWFVFDKRGRLVMSQDANMRQATQKKWKYYQYENSLDRLKSTGLLNDPTNYNNRIFHQDGASAAPQVSTSLSAYPVLSSYTIEQLTQTYYDEYQSWATGAGLSPTADLSKATDASYFFPASDAVFPYPQVVTSQSVMTRGLITGRKMEVLKSSGPNYSYLYTISFYDDKGRVIQTQGTNISGTGIVDKATTQYSWNGTPLRILEEHAKAAPNPQTHRVLTKMTYDFAGRLLNTTKTITSSITNNSVVTTITNPEKTIATYTYDETGRVKNKTLGTKPNTNYLTGPAIETLTYDYNVRGWLTGINKTYTQFSNSTNYFGLELGYDKAGASNTTTNFVPVFTGDISGMIWKSKSDGVPRKYDYTYDNVSQLTTANFLQSTGGTTWDKTYIDYSVNTVQYDINGNIKKLNQNGFVLGGNPNIDDLSYNYGTAVNANSNKIMNVLDVAPNNAQSKLGDYHYATLKTSATVDFTYDPNGNLITDVNKGITTPISYNVLNLPWVITTPKGTITYTYDAAGNKLRKATVENNVSITLGGVTTNNNTITTITTYIGGFIYQSKTFTPNTAVNTAFGYTEKLLCMLHEEGRARIVTPQSGTSNFAFDYFIRDHLGNVRITLTDEPQIDYYPVATLEAAGNAVPSEKQFYNINDGNLVSTADVGMTWYLSALNNTYQNNNGLGNPPDQLTVNPTSTSTRLYKLPANGGALGTDHTGLGITLKVTSGDVINIYGKSVWHNNGTLTNTNYLNTALLSFLNAFTGTSAVINGSKGVATGTVLNGNTATTGPLAAWLGTGIVPPPNTPKAGFNWILFDEQFRPITTGGASGFVPVKSAPNEVQSFSVGTPAGGSITIPKSGYLYVYCSNESNQDVYFDNLQVVQTRSQLIEERHYYPGGMVMQGISSRAYNKLANAFGYQGKELQAGEFYDGTGLEEYDFEARYYDPQLMRWHTQDPANQFPSPYLAMGNTWPNGTDKNGKLFGLDDLIVSAVGFVVGYVSYGITKGNWGGKALLAGAAGAVIAEGSYLTLGGGLAASTAAHSAGFGSIAAAGEFSLNYAASTAYSVIDNYGQLKKSSDWGTFGLLAGYELFSGVQAGFNSKYMENKIDMVVTQNGKLPFNEYVSEGSTSSVFGGFLSTFGKDIFRGYNPETRQWKFNLGEEFFKSMITGAGKAGYAKWGFDDFPVGNIIFQGLYTSLFNWIGWRDELYFNFLP